MQANEKLASQITICAELEVLKKMELGDLDVPLDDKYLMEIEKQSTQIV